ncbi:MAG TPA: hypothetical protein VLA24_17910 [Pseudomonadales bacterium]|nr:hypothetical protein [Pseudomonadales bacterium]
MSNDIVRVLIGDNDSSDYALDDVYITFFLDEANQNVYLAGSMAAEALAAKYAGTVSESKADSHGLHSQRRELSDRFKHYKDLANMLRQRYERTGGTFGLGAAGVFAGGISVAGKATQVGDEDRVAPSFTRELHENEAE